MSILSMCLIAVPVYFLCFMLASSSSNSCDLFGDYE